MTAELEKIIQLAKKCGAFAYINAATGFESMEDIETFYHAAQAEAFEAAAQVLDNGYFLTETSPEKKWAECVAYKIREMAKEMK